MSVPRPRQLSEYWAYGKGAFIKDLVHNEHNDNDDNKDDDGDADDDNDDNDAKWRWNV